jgi:hypothetical protein
MSLVLVDRNVRPHVSVITLNKPDRLNSMSFPLVEALYKALDEVGRDNDAWVVVLTGRGRAFCSGLDLHDRGVPPNTHDLGFSRLAISYWICPASLAPPCVLCTRPRSSSRVRSRRTLAPEAFSSSDSASTVVFPWRRSTCRIRFAR